MLGHELTAMHGLDHAQTLGHRSAGRCGMKNARLNALNCCSTPLASGTFTEGSEEERIDAAIAATRDFFERMGVPTRLSAYGLDGSSIPALAGETGGARYDPTG
ncbi:oxidoreductase YqhD [Klebsiella oxytoca]|nr:oxidoreductase YqhD [Klebsiella oxytoca]